MHDHIYVYQGHCGYHHTDIHLHICRFLTSENSTADQAYFAAIVANRELGGKHGIDATLRAHTLDALLLPALVASMPAAIAGYPLVTGQSQSQTPLPLIFLSSPLLSSWHH